MEKILLATKEWEAKGVHRHRFARLLGTAFDMSTMSYSYTHPDTQVQVALFTLLCLCVDDMRVPLKALESFTNRLFTHTPQLDPILDCLVDNLARMSDFYPSHLAQMIVSSTIDFIRTTLFDEQCADMPLHEGSLPFVKHNRLGSGLGTAFASFGWERLSFPDVKTHIQILP